MKRILFLAIVFGTAQAGAVCFQDRPSYEAIRAQLPAALQKGSLTLVHQSKTLTAAVRLFPVGTRFRVEGHAWHMIIGIEQGEETVQEICVNGTKAKIVLTNGDTRTIRFVGQTTIVRGYPFRHGNLTEFKKIATFVNSKR